MRYLFLFIFISTTITSFAISEDLFGTWIYESLVLENNDELESSEDGKKMLQIIKDEFSSLQLTIVKNGSFKFKVKDINDFGNWQYDESNEGLILKGKTIGTSYYKFVEVTREKLVLGIEGGLLSLKREIKGDSSNQESFKSAYVDNIKICKKELSKKWQLVEYYWPHNGETTALPKGQMISCEFIKTGIYKFNSGGDLTEGKWEINRNKKSFTTTNSNSASLTWQVKELSKAKLVIYQLGANNYWVMKVRD